MKMNQTAPKTIDDYIAGFPPNVQEILQAIRATVQKAAPKAIEAIKYQMPTFVLKGNLVHFAAFKNHIGFYSATRDASIEAEVALYAGPKGSLKFPLDQPMPLRLIGKIVKLRVKEDLAHAAAKAIAKQK